MKCVKDQVVYQVRDRAGGQVWFRLMDQVGDQVAEPVTVQVWDQVWFRVIDQVEQINEKR